MHQLQHDAVIVAALASGSRGNSTYIGTETEGILIDCGLSTRQIFHRLDELGLSDVALRGVLITHEHADHVGAARVLDDALHKRLGHRVPFYMTPGTREGLNRKCVPTSIHPIRSGRPFQVGSFQVEPWTIPHDTLDPVAYAVSIGDVRAGVITDLGRSTRLVERQFGTLDIAVLEFNHDVDMLMQGEYPWRLKQRVRGSHGHLSNAQASDILRRGCTGRLKHLVLAHLSDENNTPEVAMEAAQEGLHAAGAAGVNVHVASQQIPLGPLRVRAPRTVRAPRPRPTIATNLPQDSAAGQLSLFAT